MTFSLCSDPYPPTDPLLSCSMKRASVREKGKAVDTSSSHLPAELDFFKYAQGGAHSSKRKEEPTAEEAPKKKARVSQNDHHDVSSLQSSSTMPRQRVTAKGSEVPGPIESFQELGTRYNVSPSLLANLVDNGYIHPTGIQAHGVPILLEVRGHFHRDTA